jgi:hypothetical protein
MAMQKSYKSEHLLARETRQATVLLAVMIVSICSGFTTYFFSGISVWLQWTYLLHALAGISLLVYLTTYSISHLRRTIGVRRPVVLLMGLGTIVCLYFLAGSGLYLMIFGSAERLRWVNEYHVLAAFIGTGLLFFHLLAHRYLKKNRTQRDVNTNFLTLGRKALYLSMLVIIASGLVVSTATVFYETYVPPVCTTGPAVEPYQYPYGKHSFRPSQSETTAGHFINAECVAGSDRCGSCHQQIFEEWRASIHSQAASDKSYITNINLLTEKQGITATRYCEGCHAPVALLSGLLSEGGQHGGEPGTLANREGVSCMGCHGITKAVHLEGVASYFFEPSESYLFSNYNSRLATSLHNFLIRIQPEQHRVEMARDILRSSELCATCHIQFMDKDVNQWGWIKMQDEYTAWLNSHYSGQSNHPFSSEEVVRCQDCHFPFVSGIDPSMDISGRIRSHRTLGANTAIPWINNDKEQLAQTKEFLQKGKLHIKIDPPWKVDASRSNKFVSEEIRSQTELPPYFYLGEKADIKVSVNNTLVGHNFPGGTTDINEAWIWLHVVDAQGHLLFESGAIDKNNDVDPSAHFYRTVAIDRSGKHVWKHDLFNMIGDNYKLVIAPGGVDVANYSFDIPYWVKGSIVVSAVLKYRKFNNRYARWSLEDNTIKLPIVDMARDSITIPVKTKPEIYSPP